MVTRYYLRLLFGVVALALWLGWPALAWADPCAERAARVAQGVADMNDPDCKRGGVVAATTTVAVASAVVGVAAASLGLAATGIGSAAAGLGAGAGSAGVGSVAGTGSGPMFTGGGSVHGTSPGPTSSGGGPASRASPGGTAPAGTLARSGPPPPPPKATIRPTTDSPTLPPDIAATAVTGGPPSPRPPARARDATTAESQSDMSAPGPRDTVSGAESAGGAEGLSHLAGEKIRHAVMELFSPGKLVGGRFHDIEHFREEYWKAKALENPWEVEQTQDHVVHTFVEAFGISETAARTLLELPKDKWEPVATLIASVAH